MAPLIVWPEGGHYYELLGHTDYPQFHNVKQRIFCRCILHAVFSSVKQIKSVTKYNSRNHFWQVYFPSGSVYTIHSDDI